MNEIEGTKRPLKPFHKALYKGGYIPLGMQEVGKPCMIHHPPLINYGFLKYNVEGILEYVG